MVERHQPRVDVVTRDTLLSSKGTIVLHMIHSTAVQKKTEEERMDSTFTWLDADALGCSGAVASVLENI